MTAASRITSCGLWILALAGCSAEPDATFAARDSAGIRIVMGPAEDASPPWRLEERLRLGTVLGSPGEAYHELNRYSVAANEEIFILDRGNGRILRFSARSGEMLAEFGRSGDGPGEMRNPVALWLTRSGRVAVLDWARGRILTWSREGALEDDVRAPRAVRRGAHVEESAAGLLGTETQGLRDTASSEVTTVLNLVTDSGTVELASLAIRSSTWVFLKACNLSIQLPPVLAPELTWDAAAAKVVVVDGIEYEVAIFQDSALRSFLRRPIRPLPVGREDALAAWGDHSFNVGSGPCRPDWDEVLDEQVFYDELQVLGDVSVSPKGHVWVRRRSLGDGENPIDVFGPDGRYLGTFPPPTPLPVAFTADGS